MAACRGCVDGYLRDVGGVLVDGNANMGIVAPGQGLIQ